MATRRGDHDVARYSRLHVVLHFRAVRGDERIDLQSDHRVGRNHELLGHQKRRCGAGAGSRRIRVRGRQQRQVSNRRIAFGPVPARLRRARARPASSPRWRAAHGLRAPAADAPAQRLARAPAPGPPARVPASGPLARAARPPRAPAGAPARGVEERAPEQELPAGLRDAGGAGSARGGRAALPRRTSRFCGRLGCGVRLHDLLRGLDGDSRARMRNAGARRSVRYVRCGGHPGLRRLLLDRRVRRRGVPANGDIGADARRGCDQRDDQGGRDQGRCACRFHAQGSSSVEKNSKYRAAAA